MLFSFRGLIGSVISIYHSLFTHKRCGVIRIQSPSRSISLWIMFLCRNCSTVVLSRECSCGSMFPKQLCMDVETLQDCNEKAPNQTLHSFHAVVKRDSHLTHIFSCIMDLSATGYSYGPKNSRNLTRRSLHTKSWVLSIVSSSGLLLYPYIY